MEGIGILRSDGTFAEIKNLDQKAVEIACVWR
jgi:hypothetical protein